MSLEADVYARPTYLPVALEAAIRALDDTAVELWLVGLRSLRQVEVNKIQSSTERVPALYLVLDRLMGIRHEFSDSLLRLPNIEVISIRRHDYLLSSETVKESCQMPSEIRRSYLAFDF